MKIGTAARVVALGVILPFAVITATSASAEDEKKEGGVDSRSSSVVPPSPDRVTLLARTVFRPAPPLKIAPPS